MVRVFVALVIENVFLTICDTVISHLSTGDHAVEEEIFQSTLRYIFTFIEKVGFDIDHIPMMVIDDKITIFIGETSREHR